MAPYVLKSSSGGKTSRSSCELSKKEAILPQKKGPDLNPKKPKTNPESANSKPKFRLGGGRGLRFLSFFWFQKNSRISKIKKFHSFG